MTAETVYVERMKNHPPSQQTDLQSDGRQTTFEEAFSQHRYYLTKTGTLKRKFHIAWVPTDSDVSTTLGNLRNAFCNFRWIQAPRPTNHEEHQRGFHEISQIAQYPVLDANVQLACARGTSEQSSMSFQCRACLGPATDA